MRDNYYNIMSMFFFQKREKNTNLLPNRLLASLKSEKKKGNT